MRKLISIDIKATGRKVSIFRNTEYSEWVVKFYINGDYQTDADYHTDCSADAYDTANAWVNQGTNSSPSLVAPGLV